MSNPTEPETLEELAAQAAVTIRRVFGAESTHAEVLKYLYELHAKMTELIKCAEQAASLEQSRPALLEEQAAAHAVTAEEGR